MSLESHRLNVAGIIHSEVVGHGTFQVTLPSRPIMIRSVMSGSEEGENENDREPDRPHGHLGGGWLAGV